jgi:hypothetical protein
VILRTADELELSDAQVGVSADVVARYDRDVLPDGTSERDPLG